MARYRTLGVALGSFVAGVALVTTCSVDRDRGNNGLVTITVGGSSTTMGETTATAGGLEGTCSQWGINFFAADHAAKAPVTLPAGEFPFANDVTFDVVITRRCLD